MPVRQIKNRCTLFSTTRLSHQTENTFVWGNESNEDLLQDPDFGVKTLSKTETLLEYLDLLSTSSSHDLRLLFPTLDHY